MWKKTEIERRGENLPRTRMDKFILWTFSSDVKYFMKA